MAVRDDRIVAVGANLPVDADVQRIDAQGLSLAPGFIDAHTHDDRAVMDDHYFVRQGATGAKPKEALKAWRPMMSKNARRECALPAPHPDGAILVAFEPSTACLARAALVGGAGTPYAGGFFGFDVYLPATFPEV